ncbi:MAG TPA: hypothetical protein VHW65_08700 [Gemmatimonadales bacterium]|nr:hypothetical protein [Gemmatimonadales bacterium]
MIRNRWLLPTFLAVVAAVPLSAQQADSTVTMPAGTYYLAARDSTKADSVAVAGWPFVLKSNGQWTMTSPDGLSFSGTAIQKAGLLTLTDQTCGDPGVYIVHHDVTGYTWDMKSEACSGRDKTFLLLLFKTGKPKK